MKMELWSISGIILKNKQPHISKRKQINWKKLVIFIECLRCNGMFTSIELLANIDIRKFRISASENRFEKYRMVQDRLFERDFDKHIKNQLGGLTYE